MNEKDTLYQDKMNTTRPDPENPPEAGDFVFDERVVRVFPDMIRRSVPGYSLVLQLIGLLAHRYVQADSQVYDLGCSLGAATQIMRQSVSVAGVRFIGVDNSPAMIQRCKERLDSAGAEDPTMDWVLEDISTTKVSNASMTVLNYTLQFVEPRQRLSVLQRIAAGTRPGGILVLSEKICFGEPCAQELQTTLHHDFKQARGYSTLEIARKRRALEQVLQPDSDVTHRQRLQEAGWQRVVCFFQAFNFVSYLAFR